MEPAGARHVNVAADDRSLVTRREAARLMSISPKEVDRARHRGDLAAVRYGTKVLIPLDELRRFAAVLPPGDIG
ncbi:helix-turn-helix domain-containing protein [Mycolicibacterium sp. CBMA 234]|uniref:helix-turn-helix domain-containing protein n=1 Tax=Mycolicibacterium sp. CBMA 234 TaxID=1918495 RepID=UPI0012DD67C9